MFSYYNCSIKYKLLTIAYVMESCDGNKLVLKTPKSSVTTKLRS